MENLVKKLRINRQELITTLSSGLKFGKRNTKDASQILDEMDEVLDEMENSLDSPDKDLQHHKDITVEFTDKKTIDLEEKAFVAGYIKRAKMSNLLIDEITEFHAQRFYKNWQAFKHQP